MGMRGGEVRIQGLLTQDFRNGEISKAYQLGYCPCF